MTHPSDAVISAMKHERDRMRKLADTYNLVVDNAIETDRVTRGVIKVNRDARDDCSAKASAMDRALSLYAQSEVVT